MADTWLLFSPFYKNDDRIYSATAASKRTIGQRKQKISLMAKGKQGQTFQVYHFFLSVYKENIKCTTHATHRMKAEPRSRRKLYPIDELPLTATTTIHRSNSSRNATLLVASHLIKNPGSGERMAKNKSGTTR